MQILEELGTFIVAVALAVVLIGIAAVLLYYFNPQQPVDHAKAAFYPLVKPLNKTHVQLGVKPSADKVEVVEIKYQYRGRWVDVPLAKFTADRAVWLNTTDGRPVAVPCFANITVATRYGTASRAISFTPVCLQRQPQIRDDLTVLLEQMVSYGSYVLDYVAYKSTPVLTAYFVFGSIHIGFQNVGPFPYMAVNGSLTGAGQWPPSVRALVLTPGEHYNNISKITSAEPWTYPVEIIKDLCDFYGHGACSVMHRWMNIYVYWNDTLKIWINNVRIYNGTPPVAAAEFKAPQGFTVAFDPSTGTLAIKYPSVEYRYGRGYVSTQRTALNLSVSRGATQWWGWVKMINVPGPAFPFAADHRWSVMPAGPYVGKNGSLELFGVVPPFEVYSVYAAVNGSGLVVRIGDPNCGLSEQCIRTFFYPQTGTYKMDTGIKVPTGVTVYSDTNYIIAVTSTFSQSYCGGSSSPFSKCATINWYVPGTSQAVIISSSGTSESWNIGTGPYTCYIRTDGYRNTVAFEGKYWQIDCGYYVNTTSYPPQWKSLGVVRLVFNNDYTVSVYKDGQYLYKVPVYVCTGPLVTCGSGPWAPAQKLVIPVSWGPSGITMSMAPFLHNKDNVGYIEAVGNVGYGNGIVYVRDVQTVALPYYYRYNLTGAYPYRLVVKINTTEKEITGDQYYIYINVTYSGYLKLYLGDQLVAYDALYGWTIRTDKAPPSAGGSVSTPDETCIPQKERIPKGLEHRDLTNSTSGYSVTASKRFLVHEFGCGVDRTYIETTTGRVNTVDGTSYHTKDPNNKVCGFKQAQNCHGVVYCDKCPP